MAEQATPQTEEMPLAAEPLANRLPRIADWLPESWLPFWTYLAEQPLVAALVVAVVALLLALAVRFILFHSVARLTRNKSTLMDRHVLELLRRPAYTTVLLFGLTLAVNTTQLEVGTQVLINLLLTLIVLSWMRASLHISSSLLDTLAAGGRFAVVESRTVPVIDLTAKLVTIVVGSYVLLLVWGVNPVGWLASAGIVGIAVGFAAKDTLANLFSGFFIVADAPYKIGDYINLDTGERGMVSAIGLRSTRLLTRDDVEVTIPNGVIANAKIVNESGGRHLKMRNRIQVGVAYGSDADRVCELLIEIGAAHSEVCADPAPRVRMRAFGPSSLDFELLVWIEHPEDRGRIAHELYMDIYKALGAAGIEIPYSKHDVFIKEMPSGGPADQK